MNDVDEEERDLRDLDGGPIERYILISGVGIDRNGRKKKFVPALEADA